METKKPASPRAPPMPEKFIRHAECCRFDRVQARGCCIVPVATRDAWDRLFSEGYRADVCVFTDGGGLIPAHYTVLGMASQVLKNMVKLSRSRGRRRSISIRGVPHQAVHTFLRFLYSSCYEQEEMQRYVLHLLVLSHVFVIPSLKQACVRELERGMITIENVVDVFQLARLCDAPRLALVSHRIVVGSFKAVSATDGWKVIRKSNPRLEKELIESVVEADSRKQVKLKKAEEKRIYIQLYEAMEALIHICRDGCRTIGPHDKVLKADEAPCTFPACKGLESLLRHFAGCKARVPGGCAHCRRMWQLLELHSRMCTEPDLCRVPLCRHFKEKMQHLNKKEEVKWKVLVSKVLGAKTISFTPFPSSVVSASA
ncbi:hypothetical protein AMTRI_Chr12g271810 [Amborella trichopoda]|uniref:BTB domain-containing protein n=1 Tax=Amborella trichopoda TaxID=13333 RepID=W1PS87_AMBTC|nr:BTB/POZ and TAZ domain-containing protein 4 [Amborella trichopoda]ERN10908.1 hypothetical protein AMTR_s00164p00032900 [Amborella trichopoda]|eukprot:XP_006849327.1 BTB/POZ and TAZ domain-containing protein 4 [Amborella trichopoda]